MSQADSLNPLPPGPDPDPSSAPLPPGISPGAELFRLAAPSVVSMSSFTLMQFVDKWMVSKIGPDPIYVGSQGSGGLAAWVPISFMFGTLAIINTFVSQNLGAGSPRNGPKYAWNAAWLALVGWVLLIPYGLSLPAIFAAMGYEQQRIDLACQYGQTMIFGSLLTLLTRAFGQFFYGMHRPSVVMVGVVSGNLVNIALNYVLIFGAFGIPALGLRGAALATLAGTFVEALIPALVFLGPKLNSALATRSQWRPRWSVMKEIFAVGWPAGAMFGSEMVCWGFFMLYLVGGFSKYANTAGFIAQQWMALSFMPAVGISNALASIVGRYIGMKRPDLAAHRAALGIRIAMIYMGTCGILFVIFRYQMIDLFIPAGTPPQERLLLLQLGGTFLIATATFQIFDAVAMTISGALRGAGDTHFIGIVTIIASWTIMVGGGLFMMRFFPQLGPLGAWMAAAVYIMVLAIASIWRYRQGKWRSMSVIAN